MVNALIEFHGANLEAVDQDGLIALMLPAINGHVDTVNALAGTENANVEAANRRARQL